MITDIDSKLIKYICLLKKNSCFKHWIISLNSHILLYPSLPKISHFCRLVTLVLFRRKTLKRLVYFPFLPSTSECRSLDFQSIPSPISLSDALIVTIRIPTFLVGMLDSVPGEDSSSPSYDPVPSTQVSCRSFLSPCSSNLLPEHLQLFLRPERFSAR